MGNIFYFLPGEKQATQETIQKYGLGYILPEKTETPDQIPVTNGPNKQEGVVFTFQDAQGKAHLGMHADAEWSQIPGGDAWCGLNSNCWPGPEDLVRSKTVGGYTAQLLDAQDWLIPAVHDMNGDTAFEQSLQWDGNTFQCGAIPDRHKELFDAVSKMWEKAEACQDGADVSLKIEEDAMACCWGIAVNYRIGPYEIGKLGILTTKNYVQVMQAMMGIPSLLNIKKKEVLGGQDGIYGVEAAR